MNKSLPQFIAAGLLSLAAIFAPTASGEVLLSEDFNYPTGNLYGQGGWLQSNHKENPIQVTGTKLSLAGFASGQSVKLTPSTSQDQDCVHALVDRASDGTVTGITTGSVYVATLINVQNVTDQIYFMSFGSSNSSNLLKDGASAIGNNGCSYLIPGAEGKYKIGIGKTSSKPTANTTTEFDYNTTHLLVVKYTLVEGTTNDTFEAWIDPAVGDAEPSAELSATVAGQADIISRGIVGLFLNQATGSVKKSPEMLVGPVRVATSWAELWSEGGETPDPSDKGEISVGKVNLPEALYQYQKYPVTVNVKASNLSEDITVGGLNSAVKSDVTVIPAAEACSAAGYNLQLTLDASAGTEISTILALTSGEANANVGVKVAVQPTETFATFRMVPNLNVGSIYYFSGTATVTYVDASTSTIYMQDVAGGMALKYEYSGYEQSPLAVGDMVKNFYLMTGEPEVTGGVNSCYLMAYPAPEGMGFGTVTETGVEKQPIELALADLAENAETYLNRLVKVTDVTFAAAGQKFGTAGTEISSNGASGKVRSFAGTNLVGTEIPATAQSVTGISTSRSSVMISMRSATDLVASAADAEALEVTKELLVDENEYYPVNVATPFAKFTVKAKNLSKAAAVYVTGKDRDQFTADLEEIPAGTGTYDITVAFKPTKTGRQQANLMIETSNTELTYNQGFAAQAYDPDNLPTFTVDASAVTEFSAAAGSTQEQTVTINATGLLDYGSIRVLGQGQGAFRIGSTMFLKDGATQLKVTFAPAKEGTFTETIEFTSPKAETKTIVVKGKTTGSAPTPGDKEGDELVFDTSSPLTYYQTDFSGSGVKNKPLSLAGWKNVAALGNRAWWSYTEADGNECAKVTSYVWGGATENCDVVEMLLLSPALDYKNCTSRLLSFRIKGETLSDGQVGEFAVLYVDPELPETERYQVLVGGSDIPVGSDASGEWQEYVVDLEGLDLADTFFIGFYYISEMGAISPEQYYVDDFCYGSTTQPFIRVDKRQVVGSASVGESVDLETVTVSGLNLTAPIAVSLEGADKGHFVAPVSELPAEGGELTFAYAPQSESAEDAPHAAYVNLSSEGAPASRFIIGGMTKASSGVALPGVAEAERIAAYDLNGREVVAETSAAEAMSAVRSLGKGVYVLRVTAADGSVKSVKYLRP